MIKLLGHSWNIVGSSVTALKIYMVEIYLLELFAELERVQTSTTMTKGLEQVPQEERM